jgi:hypothetical protein
VRRGNRDDDRENLAQAAIEALVELTLRDREDAANDPPVLDLDEELQRRSLGRAVAQGGLERPACYRAADAFRERAVQRGAPVESVGERARLGPAVGTDDDRGPNVEG